MWFAGMESEERRYEALAALLDYSKGTLWWVNDRLWSRAIQGFVPKRKGHPGLSLGRTKADGLYSVLPMAIGTTKNSGHCFKVYGLSDQDDHEGPTCFHVLRPYPLVFDEFGRSDGIFQNAYKPRLNSDEYRRLDAFLKGKDFSDVR